MSVNDHTTADPSSASLERWWCETCGDDLPEREKGGVFPRFCSVECVQWAIDDAKRRGLHFRDPERARLYPAISWLRRKLP